MLLGAIWNPGAAVANCSCDHFKPVLYILFMIYTCFKMYINIHVLKVPPLFKHFLEMDHPL